MIIKRTLLAIVIACVPLAAQSFCLLNKDSDRADRSHYLVPAFGFNPGWYPAYAYTPVMPSAYQGNNPPVPLPGYDPLLAAPLPVYQF